MWVAVEQGMEDFIVEHAHQLAPEVELALPSCYGCGAPRPDVTEPCRVCGDKRIK